MGIISGDLPHLGSAGATLNGIRYVCLVFIIPNRVYSEKINIYKDCAAIFILK